MAGKADFTEQEWSTLQKGVTGAGMLVSVAHRDFTDSFGEAKAITSDLAEHRRRARAHSCATSPRRTAPASAPSRRRTRSSTARSTRSPLPSRRSPRGAGRLEAYRALMLEVANAAAEAKGGVQQEETAAIEKITAALATG